ncbi:HC-toxin efflux carrier TOXA [Fusarium tjaetaba]|uniref:HC-toxin efflux carrier TOXA n=1 Tax=Fusarium tjaetaba TaxID=1567544 RepID=A0A8H5RL49_9HYPO|nr:HC-toxin efflux carrier TOXA [Fusarium tjaetaba]KAF5635010.1 HC-toxin efflux carrier TOXA [Fusarium tjaetaba]
MTPITDEKSPDHSDRQDQTATPDHNSDEVDKSRDSSISQAVPKLLTGFSLYCILVALILTIFLGSLDMTIVATAIPKITDDFKSLDQASWYGSAFFMANGGFQSSWGKAYKYFSLKATFLIALFIFELGSLICAVAPDSNTLIFGRAINGLGGAGIGTGTYTIVAVISSPAKRPTYTGIIGMSYGIAAVAGPLIGGVFSDKVTWRWCFYINLPLGGVAAAIIVFFFRPKGVEPAPVTLTEKILQLDLPGVAVLIGAITSCLLALEYSGQSKSWGSSTVIGLLVGVVLITALFFVWEHYQGERAMVVSRIITKRPVGVSAIFTFFFGGSYFLTIYYLPMYFQGVKGASPSMSGVMSLPLILSVTIAMMLSGLFITATGRAALSATTGAIIGTIGAGLLYTLATKSSAGEWIGYQIVAGLGWGVALQVPIMMVQASVAPEDLASTTSVILLCQCLGGCLYVGAAQTAFLNTMIHKLSILAPDINLTKVIATGYTAIRDVYSSAELPSIIASYMAGIKVSLALSIAGCGLASLVSVFNDRRVLSKDAIKEVSAVA